MCVVEGMIATWGVMASSRVCHSPPPPPPPSLCSLHFTAMHCTFLKTHLWQRSPAAMLCYAGGAMCMQLIIEQFGFVAGEVADLACLCLL